MSIEKVIDAAIQTKELVSILQETAVSFSDLEEVSLLNPKIMDNIDIIRNWVRGDSSNIEKIAIQQDSTPLITESAPVETKRLLSYNRLTYEDVKVITENVIVKYDKKPIDAAVKQCVKKYNKCFSNRTLTRLVNKTTFSNITDKYYIIENGRIIVKTPGIDVEENKNESTKLTVKTHSDEFEEFIKTLETRKGKAISEKVRHNLTIIWNMICDNNGHIETSVKSFEIDILREYLNVKAIMVNMGLYNHTDFDRAIMISDGVTKYGKHRSGRIYNYVEKHYKTKITTEFLNKILNKEIYDEVTDKFFK